MDICVQYDTPNTAKNMHSFMPSLENWGDGLYVYTCTQEHEKIGAWKMCAHALCEVSPCGRPQGVLVL